MNGQAGCALSERDISHAIFGMINGICIGPHSTSERIANTVLALFEAAAPRIRAEALREYASEVEGGEVWTWDADRLAGELRDRADRLEAEAD